MKHIMALNRKYIIVHNVFVMLLSMCTFALAIIYVTGLQQESMPGAPKALEKVNSFYIAECMRLTVRTLCARA